MMKFLSTITLMLVASATAFTVSPGNFKVGTVTRLHMTPDPEMVQHLTSIGTEAAHVVFRECDNFGCAMVEGHVENDGNWHFSEGLPSQQAPTKVEMLMFEQDDCE